MAPDIDLRLAVIARALRETILPAIDPEDAGAVEQAHLAAATIDLVRGQIGYAHAFEVADARRFADLVARIGEVMPGDPALAGAREMAFAVSAAAADPMTPTCLLAERNRALREEIVTLIDRAAASGAPFEAVATSLLAAERPHLLRERAWVAATGFDAAALPSIADGLAGAADGS